MKVTLLCNRDVRLEYVAPRSIDRLTRFAAFEWVECNHLTSYERLSDPNEETVQWLAETVNTSDAVVVCHGAPRLSAEVVASIDARFIGELEGDRFSPRVDVEAAHDASITVVDTTHGSSYAVAEWALALILVSLRNAGHHFRRFVEGADIGLTMAMRRQDRGFSDGELRAKSVGLIGLGYIAQELIALLRPFGVVVRAHDPFVDAGRADALDVDLTSLPTLMSLSDVVVVLAPETPLTHHLVCREQFDRLRSGAVFVNVSRGSVVDPVALLDRLGRGDLWAGLDVWEPDPCPIQSALRQSEHVFYTPHIAGVTAAARRRTFDLMVDELERFSNGVEPRAQIDRRVERGRGLPLETAPLPQPQNDAGSTAWKDT